MDLAPMLSPVQHLGEYIREQRTAAQISLRSLAAKAGVSNPYLSQVERGLRKPSASVLAQIAQGLSISTETLLVKAGILSDATRVVEAIRGDTRLTDHHKAMLIEIYTAFRQESGEASEPDDSEAAEDTAPEPSEPATTQQEPSERTASDALGDNASNSAPRPTN
jgi:transcriptional regulator with XRE-family HTH domain